MKWQGTGILGIITSLKGGTKQSFLQATLCSKYYQILCLLTHLQKMEYPAHTAWIMHNRQHALKPPDYHSLYSQSYLTLWNCFIIIIAIAHCTAAWQWFAQQKTTEINQPVCNPQPQLTPARTDASVVMPVNRKVCRVHFLIAFRYPERFNWEFQHFKHYFLLCGISCDKALFSSLRFPALQ